MSLTQRIAIIGECMIELKQVNGQLEQGFGGDSLNTAVYFSRLTRQQGITTHYVTGMGKDPFSTSMLNAWQEESISTELVHISDTHLPGIYSIENTPDGERQFYYWRNDSAAKYWLRGISTEDLLAHFGQQSLIYLTGISLAILPDDCRDKLLACLKQCRRDGVKIAFDNNYRSALWPNSEQAQQCYRNILSITDMAFLTFDDECMLWGDSEEQHTLNRTRRFGVEEIIIKRGALPCIVANQEEQWQVAAQSISNIVDTTAAGDSFSAAYLARRLLGASAIDAAMAGHTLAGNVIQHAGAIIPHASMPTL